MAGNTGTKEQEQDTIRQIRARITGKLHERLVLHKTRKNTSIDAVVSAALDAALPKS